MTLTTSWFAHGNKNPVRVRSASVQGEAAPTALGVKAMFSGAQHHSSNMVDELQPWVIPGLSM
jgi:hypothetical protein